MSFKQYEQCPNCIDLRSTSETYSLALKCSTCKGTGIIRDPDDYQCNGCGEKFNGHHGYPPEGMWDQNISGGYDSLHLQDLTTYDFSLCEKCLRVMFDGFKIPPAIGAYAMEAYESYEEERKYYVEQLYRRSEEPLAKFRAGLCTSTKGCQNSIVWRIFNSGHLAQETGCCEEHKEKENYSITVFVPAKEVASGALQDIGRAFIKASVRMNNVSYWRFAPHCLADFAQFNIEKENVSCVVALRINEDKSIIDSYYAIINSAAKIIAIDEYNIFFIENVWDDERDFPTEISAKLPGKIMIRNLPGVTVIK